MIKNKTIPNFIFPMITMLDGSDWEINFTFKKIPMLKHDFKVLNTSIIERMPVQNNP